MEAWHGKFASSKRIIASGVKAAFLCREFAFLRYDRAFLGLVVPIPFCNRDLRSIMIMIVSLRINSCYLNQNAHQGGSITVVLASCLTGLDLTKQVNLLFIQHKQSS